MTNETNVTNKLTKIDFHGFTFDPTNSNLCFVALVYDGNAIYKGIYQRVYIKVNKEYDKVRYLISSSYNDELILETTKEFILHLFKDNSMSDKIFTEITDKLQEYKIID